MKTKYCLMALLLSLTSMGAHAAGGPMHENFTELIALSNDAIELGQQGDAKAFADKVKETIEILKTQEVKGSSIRLQRTDESLKTALKEAKAGNLQAGIDAVQQGISIMQTDKK